MAVQVFQPLPTVPDHPALEQEILELWEREETFEQVRERNRGGPKFSFMDGPMTANNPAGVHHGHGRTLKDVFQRYKALRGFDQRYQNGFDCQGLWVEVEVEKSLGLNSKHEIEEYGLARFAERCKERVAEFAGVITEQSRRLGMWMDWANSYHTFSDTNIEYIWRFLKEVHARGWLYKGHRSTQWCPRCGTSLSQHEQAGEGNYAELEHPSLYVRFPLLDRQGEALAIWTTTPWTLPANVAAAVKPDAEYGLRENGTWVAVALYPDEKFSERLRGEELEGWRYEGPFDYLPPQQGIEHRVIPWEDVVLDEGTGIVHIAPGAGTEDFELSRRYGLPVLVPINEAGEFYPAYAEFEGLTTDEVEEPVVESLRKRRLLVETGRIIHRYPICWRCRTPLVFRVVDDWFIAADEIRQPLLDANAGVEWTPDHYSKRMDDWLRNMGDWNISRKRYFGLPLPIYPCQACEKVTVVGSKAELAERALSGIEGLQELHRPWIDEVEIRCEHCGAEGVRRVVEVGDAWLDAGIVPLSTLGWQNPEWKPHGYATGAAEGLSEADLPDNAYWEKWFPANWVSEMREQIRLWFYAISFMSVTMIGRSPYERVLTYEKVLDESGREMHRSWGNAIAADEALDGMGADVMRWGYCEQNPGQNLRFGHGPAKEIRRRMLTLWNSGGFLITYAEIEGFKPSYEDLAEPFAEDLRPLDRWLLARTQQLVAEATDAYERYWTPDVTRLFEAFVDDLSNWYIRRSRRRFYSFDEAAFRTLWHALAQGLRVVAPLMPFLADELWRNLVAGACESAPASVHLAGWPEERKPDDALLEEVAETRRVVELGRQARSHAGLKLRQPLRRMAVQGSSVVDVDEIKDELRVKEVEFGPTGEHVEMTVKPNLPVVGPKLGKDLPRVREALASNKFVQVDQDTFEVDGVTLTGDDVIVQRKGAEGWSLAGDDGVTVMIDTRLDPELELEGRVLDLIHQLNTMRKEAGLELTDRIVVTLPEAQADLLSEHADWIKDETLAVRIEADGTSGEPEIAKA